MAEAGTLAYPIILMAMYGVSRVGRHEMWEALEWLRLGALAMLFGLVLAVQVKLVMLGVAAQPVPLISGVVSVLGTAALVGLYIWERWQRYARPLPRLSAQIAAE